MPFLEPQYLEMSSGSLADLTPNVATRNNTDTADKVIRQRIFTRPHDDSCSAATIRRRACARQSNACNEYCEVRPPVRLAKQNKNGIGYGGGRQDREY
jgi:hypothetical protein